jgi:putative two-component system response regulator
MREKLLIVDDDALNLSILREILEDDYQLVEAHNGVEALAAFEREQPAVVLMDIMMPQMDGYEACRQIKASAGGDDAHVILVSAKASTSERVRGYEVGADDYLVKPFDDDELLAKVRVQVRLRNALVELESARARLAADNVQLEDTVERQTKAITDTRDLLVFAMAKLADSRDPETGEHLDRMRNYCQILAEHLSTDGPYADQITPTFIENLYRSSPLHDIGKVGIPDAILLKPGRLTQREFELMQQHTVIGAQALEEVAHTQNGCGAFLEMAIDIARSHHERWDGSGYPDGLAGDRIPLAARICAVADVFDALTSVRVYKAAFGPEIARSMILEERGKHFDPALVDAFEACFDSFLNTRSGITTSTPAAHQPA